MVTEGTSSVGTEEVEPSTFLGTESDRRSRTSRCWFFTWNNYPINAIPYLIGLFDAKYLSGLVVGREVGEEGTPHLQGVLALPTPRRMSALRSRFHSDGFENVCHWQITKNRKAAVKYCKKDGDFEERGVVSSQQGDRTDLKTALQFYQQTRDLSLFKEEFPEMYVKYAKGICSLLDDVPRSSPPEVYWIYGPTGTGKTRYCWAIDPDLWSSTNDLKWFDGYNGQASALLDDFRSSHIRFTSLLRLLDRYPLQVPIKGGFVQWRPQKIYITSPGHPKDCYDVGDENVAQLLRRITKIWYTGEAHQGSAILDLAPDEQLPPLPPEEGNEVIINPL